MRNDPSHQTRIHDILQNCRGIETLKQLFWGELNNDRHNDPISRESWTPRDISSTADDPLLFATGGIHSDFHLIYTRLEFGPPAPDRRTSHYLPSPQQPSLCPIHFQQQRSNRLALRQCQIRPGAPGQTPALPAHHGKSYRETSHCLRTDC